MRDLYKLEGKKAVPVSRIEEWSITFDGNRHVADDFIETASHVKPSKPSEALTRMTRVAEELDPQSAVDPIRVSTAFLGINHNFTDKGPPLLFETMVFGGVLDGECGRTSTWEEAEREHVETLARVLRTLPPDVKVRSALP